MKLRSVKVKMVIGETPVEAVTDIEINQESIDAIFNSVFLGSRINALHDFITLASNDAISSLRKADRNLWAKILKECAERLENEVKQ